MVKIINHYEVHSFRNFTRIELNESRDFLTEDFIKKMLISYIGKQLQEDRDDIPVKITKKESKGDDVITYKADLYLISEEELIRLRSIEKELYTLKREYNLL
jgi:hypothetical protein